MVLEQLMESSKIRRHMLYVFSLGFAYVIMAYFGAIYLFPDIISVATLFITTILLVPSVYMLLNREERIDRKYGTKNFFRNHKQVFEIFLFLFFGVLAGYFILGTITNVDTTFDYQLELLDNTNRLSDTVVADFTEAGQNPQMIDFFSVLSHNLFIAVLAFGFSTSYGAGAVFLVVLNASVFSAFILFVLNHIGRFIAGTGTVLLFLVHLIPELTGFLAAAVAGGVVSRAFFAEKIGTQGFKNVMKDAIVILLISFLLILIAALLEVFVTSRLVGVVI